MFKAFRPMLVAIPLVLLATTGCNSKAEAVKYNNALAGITKELEALGKSWGEDVGKNSDNPTKMKEIQSANAAKADDIFKRGRALTPPNTNEGKALHSAFLSYLDTEEEIIKTDFPMIINSIGKGNQSDVKAQFDRVSKKEDEKVKALKDAQQKFAQANGVKIQ
jgi:hypothetical protein